MTIAKEKSMKFDLGKAPLRVSRVRLNVRDLGTVATFYQQVLGLVELASVGDRITLGAGDVPLLDLIRNPDLTSRNRHEAGLFHTAFLLPDRADLGRWLAHAKARRIRLQGASDHLVSEAIYLDDPEGNGIEVYTDRPVSHWQRQSGTIAMATEPLDVQSLLQAAGDSVWKGAPDGTIVGHIHLQVGDTIKAEAFWRDIMGFDLTNRYPDASFFGSGGYHHQVASNVWNSRGAGTRPDGMAGLAGFELVARYPATRDAIASKAEAAGHLLKKQPVSITVSDPWGTPITVTE